MRILILLIISGLMLTSCDSPKVVDLEAEKAKILEMHHDQRDFHFNKDSIAFAAQFSDQFIAVNRGKITSPTREQSIARYHAYFSSVEFEKWDDLAEPIIHFSEDATLAYTIVDKIVQVSYEVEGAEPIVDSTHFAWTTIYRKYGAEWKIDCVTSTEVPAK